MHPRRLAGRRRPTSPKTCAIYKRMLDAECFTRRPFPLRNLIRSVIKVHNRFSTSGVPYQYYITDVRNSKGASDFLHPLKLGWFPSPKIMKKFKSLLHVWITLASVLSFLGGWIVFSRSTKPAAFNGLNSPAAQTSIALSPIPSLDSLMASTTSSFPTALQPLTMYQLSSQPSTTVLRTRGS